MPLKRHRSPQEKKKLSLKKDRRNDYGENNKSSRKAVPLQKRLTNRKVRRADHLSGSDDDATEAEYRERMKRRWKKIPDASLEEHIDRRKR